MALLSSLSPEQIIITDAPNRNSKPQRSHKNFLNSFLFGPKIYKILGQKIKHLRSALFWEIAQRILPINYQRFGTTYRSHLQVPRNPFFRVRIFCLLKMGPRCFPETSVMNYNCTLRNIPQERRFHLQHRGSLKSKS